MSALLYGILSLPGWALYGIIGAVGGAVGALAGLALGRRFDRQKTVPIAGAIVAVSFIVAALVAMSPLKASVTANAVMDELSEQRLFKVLFRIHPEARAELRARMAEIPTDAPRAEVFLRGQAASADVVAKYFMMHLPSVPDAIVHKILLRQIEVMREFQSRPAYCVDYYLGTPRFEQGDLTTEFLETESTLKAEALEGAVANPTPLASPLEDEVLAEQLSMAYLAKDYRFENIANLGRLDTIPAEEACQYALEFVDAIASLGPTQSAVIFKSLIALDEQPN
ncbi:hypothetical protein [Dongia deserti]|uniref:hypothetical protein n=1 Tax=Dongia deserti TaxID=2268030 RepID=UPI0013C5137F|nr:hypothetical protein [Dongia deserti]